MFRAVWNGAMLAEIERTIKVEGNYFPPGSLRREAAPRHRLSSPATDSI